MVLLTGDRNDPTMGGRRMQARTEYPMKFGQKVRSLRQAMGLSQRALAPKLGINFTYLSKIENERLDSGDYPSEALICTIARVLDASEDELLLLAEKIPPAIRRRVMERPDAFRVLARLDDRTLDRLLEQVVSGQAVPGGRITRPRLRRGRAAPTS